MTSGASDVPEVPTAGGYRDRRAQSEAQLAESVRFEVLGYGATCSACGSLVVGADGQEIHRRHHRALAVLGRLDG